MVKDALKAYLQLASGLTEVTRERAMSAAQALVTQVGSRSRNPKESSAQVRALADELAKTARDNRDLVMGMVRAETERAVSAVGAASTDEVTALRRRVDAMQSRLDQLVSDADEATPTPLTVKKVVAKKVVAKRAVAKKAGSQKPGTQRGTATKAAASIDPDANQAASATSPSPVGPSL